MDILTQQNPQNYDPRWFIWTIVFLVVTGISLVGYITLSSDSEVDIVIPPVKARTVQNSLK